MGFAVTLLTFIFALLFILYKRWAKLYDRWKERGIVHRKPYPFVGNMIDNVLKKKTMGEIFRDIAVEFKNNKHIGVYNFISADLMITDPEDVQTVLVKEFSHFMDRGPKFERKGPMDKHMFVLTGAEWKGVRTKVSPAFSSGKLKAMFPLMVKSYDYTSKYLDKQLSSDTKIIDLKDILEMYIVSVSASTIYGMDPSRLADPDCEFKRILNETTKLTLRTFIAMTVNVFFPKLSSFIDSPMKKKVEQYFIDLVLNTFKERTESGKVRDDIIQQLLQLKQNGKIEVSQWVKEDEEELGSDQSTMSETVQITDDILVSQGFIFLMAGFDPLKSTLGMLLVELCSDRQCLDKVVEEINSCTEKHGGFTLQAVKEMQYLDWCISEALRLYPAAEMVTRQCIKDYTFDNGTIVEAETRVIIPILHLHKNPEHYPEPEKFKPERFENPPSPSLYLPFGTGPRMCLARRFALQEMKVFVARLLQDYDIRLNSKTELPVRSDKWFFLRRNDSDIYIDFTKRIK